MMDPEKKCEKGLELDRRRFGKSALAAAACLAGAGAKAGLDRPRARVFLSPVSKGAGQEEIERAVREAAESATDFSWLGRGDKVLIKPALNSGNPYPATTHPGGVRAMIKLLKEKGAGKVFVGDMSGIEHVKLTPKGVARGSTRELMKSAGLFQAVVEAGGEPYFWEEDGWEGFFEDELANGPHWRGGVMMPRLAKEVDHIILMPRTSRHALAGVTLGLKAAVGYWRTDTRLEYHRDASTLQEKTAEANTARTLLEKQRLVLTTATKAQTTFGPDQGYSVELDPGLVFASTSIVAHDMVSLALFLEARKLTPKRAINAVKDPYTSPFMVHMGNRLVVYWLSGARKAARSERLARNDITGPSSDRTLSRAFQVLGGRPEVELRETRPAAFELLERLSRTLSS